VLFEDVKLTVPLGVLSEFVVSVEVTVHVDVPDETIELGAQLTTVDVLSLLAIVTVTVAGELVLVL